MTSEKELNKIIEAIDAQMKKDGISRRDALKNGWSWFSCTYDGKY